MQKPRDDDWREERDEYQEDIPERDDDPPPTNTFD